MFGAENPSLEGPLPEILLEKLREEKEPAFIMNLKSLTLVAANTSGQIFFPHVNEKNPFSLDTAMPAVRRIQQLAQNDNLPQKLTNLVFWTAKGVQKLNCKLERLESRADGALLLLKVREDPFEPLPPLDLRSRESMETFSPPQSDKETLDQIARLIRLHSKSPEHEKSLPNSPLHEEKTDLKKENLSLPLGDRRLKTIFSGEHNRRTQETTLSTDALELSKNQNALDRDQKEKRESEELLQERSLPKTFSTLLKNLKFERLDLSSCLTECLSLIKKQKSAQDIKFEFHAPYNKYTVMADATSIKHILLHLLSNAVKFSPSEGEVRITLTSNVRGDICLSIWDRGRAMTSLEIAHGLRSFEDPTIQQEESVSSLGTVYGRGEGLPLTKALAEANGGALSIQSSSGQGTCVSLIFVKRPFTVI